MKIELTRDWREFLSLLIARRVRFVLIGGHAVAAHGEPRLTEDLDVFVEPSTRNAKRLREALVDFGFGAVAPRVVDLARADKGCSRRIRRIHRLETGRSHGEAERFKVFSRQGDSFEEARLGAARGARFAMTPSNPASREGLNLALDAHLNSL